jgi:hypothetical protein
MRYLLLIISLFGFTTIAFSQDSISVRTEIDTFSQSNYEGQYDFIFARKEPQKTLLKMGIISALLGGPCELVSFEHKLNQDISLHYGLNILTSGTPSSSRNVQTPDNPNKDTLAYFSSPSFGFSIEPRWYFTMRKDIKNGLVANNFHGNYLGLRTSFELEISTVPKPNTPTQIGAEKFVLNQYMSNELTFGIQRRILNRQYIDFGIGTGIKTRLRTTDADNKIKSQQWLFNYRLAYGFILNKTTKVKNDAARCDVLRCFEEEKGMWKIGLSQLISRLNEKQFIGGLLVAYEQKIPKTSLSIEGSIGLKGQIQSKKVILLQTDDKYALNLGLLSRYYYDLKKRIARGKSANNLSGEYFGLRVDYINAASTYNLQSNAAIGTFLWGKQQRLLKHLNLDFWIGYSVESKKTKLETTQTNGLSGNFAISLAF